MTYSVNDKIVKLKAPKTIEPFGGPAHKELAPASMHVRYEYAAEGEQPEVSLTWYQGTHRPENPAVASWDSGVLFIGDKGMLVSDYGRYKLLPEETFKDFKPPEPFIPASRGHHQEWIHACKTGDPTTCNFEYAGWHQTCQFPSTPPLSKISVRVRWLTSNWSSSFTVYFENDIHFVLDGWQQARKFIHLFH